MFYTFPTPAMDEKKNNQEENEEALSFKSTTGCRLYRKRWQPTSGNPRGLVFVVHGFAEHCQWYEHIAKALNDEGLLVAGHDHVGHGQSEGQRAQVQDFEDYVDDTLSHVDHLRKEYPDAPTFLLGHSMGGAIGIRCVLKRPHLFKGLISIGPLVVPSPSAISPWKITIGRVIASIFPSLPVERLDCTAICRDPDVVKRYTEDPLVYHGGVRTKWGMCVLHALQDSEVRLQEISTALLTIQGDCDKLCDKTGAETLHNKASSTDKKLSIYPGAYHQVHNEPDGVGEEALQEITSWITARI